MLCRASWRLRREVALTLFLFALLAPSGLCRRRERNASRRGREEDTTAANEKKALLKFKRGLTDPRGILENWKEDTDPCKDIWSGIECTETNHIRIINLPGFSLKGKLPAFTDLVALEAFRMPNNSLTGSLPEEWHALLLLEVVDLTGNNISGPLPASWSEANSLKTLYLNGNQIEGGLPRVWWLGHFEVITLAGNRINGTLPINWANMVHLEVLDLAHNRLTGGLPINWSALDRLRVLRLSGNEFFGPLPSSWADLNRLTDLRLDDNDLVGELPPKWNFLLSAKFISLRANNLGGDIPESWAPLSQTCRIVLSDNPFVCNLPPQGSLLAKDDGPGLVVENTNAGRCPSPSSLDTQALLQFKAELHLGVNGDVLEDWDWKSNSACADGWSGIQCKNERVTVLDLSSSGLSGYLSEKLSQMTALETLDLAGNKFGGVLPASWGNISTLKHLNFSGNSIGGALPREWRDMTSLEVLDLSENNFLGELPPEWSTLENLQVLKANNNTLDGQLPYAWSTMTSIRHIELHNNILAGALPFTWGAFKVVEVIDLSANNLTGPVPPQWENMSQLKVFNLQGNSDLCGGIPASLPRQEGEVKDALAAPCPDYITESILLVNFKHEVEDPDYSLALWKADAPSCLPKYETWPGITCEDGRVVELDLTSFQIKGELPEVFTELSMLRALRLAKNQFSGPLPPSWAELFRLEHLNLSNNALAGPLPEEWATLVSLASLDISGNNFEDSMPSEWSRMAKLRALNVSDNVNLCGGLPSDFSRDIVVISENSTFLQSCSSNGGSSWALPIVSVLLTVFILGSLLVWISCFCYCCQQRKKQRTKLLEMMSTSLSKSREAQSREMRAHASGSFEMALNQGPSTSDRASRSSRSINSSNRRLPARIAEVPVYANHASRLTHPYLSPAQNTRHAPSHSATAFEPVSRRKSTPATRSITGTGAGRPRPHTTTPSIEANNDHYPAGFGSIQSVQPTGSVDGGGERTPRSPQSPILPRPQSGLELCRTPMDQPATPTEIPTEVLKVRSATPPATPVVDPRQQASRIPRHPTPSAASGSIRADSSTHNSVNRSVHSDRRSSTIVDSSPSKSSRHVLRGSSESLQPVAEPDLSIEVTCNPDMQSADMGEEEEKKDDHWQYETTVELPATATTVREPSSPTTEMFRWLESYYHSGTFDLDDVPRELLNKAAAHHHHSNAAGPSTSAAPPRQVTLNSATLASHRLQSSTKELLMWLESRIEEERGAELNQVRRRVYPSRRDWARDDTNDAPLFNYKTASTITDDS